MFYLLKNFKKRKVVYLKDSKNIFQNTLDLSWSSIYFPTPVQVRSLVLENMK